MPKKRHFVEYNKNYFLKRNLNDPKRLKSFLYEKKILEEFIDFNLKVCDIGCSTGEFLEFLKWDGSKYGMEINPGAIKVAKKKGINFKKNILTNKNFFDVIIFRGTIQHVDQPFFYIEKSYESLKKGGYLFILATPNISSIYYRLFKNLPALDDEKNYYLPSYDNLINIVSRYGFKFIKGDFPYSKSGYDNSLSDYFYFVLKLFGFFKKKKISFPGNMMNLVFKK